MAQDKKKFVIKVGFVNKPGYLGGPGRREEVGLPQGSGPYRVITQLGVYGFDSQTKRMKLLALPPGIELEIAVNNSSFEIIVSDQLETNESSAELELRILRELEPMEISIGGLNRSVRWIWFTQSPSREQTLSVNFFPNDFRFEFIADTQLLLNVLSSRSSDQLLTVCL